MIFLVDDYRAITVVWSNFFENPNLATAAAGIARCSIRMGDLRRGIQLANNNPSKSVKRECGEILDKMKQYKEAGELFIKAESWEKGAASFLRAKLLNKVGDVIHRVDSVKIHQVIFEVLV